MWTIITRNLKVTLSFHTEVRLDPPSPLSRREPVILINLSVVPDLPLSYLHTFPSKEVGLPFRIHFRDSGPTV